jgi:hypothetical protein
MNIRQLAVSAIILVALISSAIAAPPTQPAEEKGKSCRMEQQCHWENFKKVCVYVKVCR